MRAEDLAMSLPAVPWDAPARQAARLVADPAVRAILVVDEKEELRGVVTDFDLLRFLIPAYVSEAGQLAAVLDEQASAVLWKRLEGRTAADLMPKERDEPPVVGADDTLLEVAAAMIRTRSPAVAVRGRDRILGGITLADLLKRLLIS